MTTVSRGVAAFAVTMQGTGSRSRLGVSGSAAPKLGLSEREVFVGRRRVLAIGLDGFDVGFADRLIASGDLPTLSALRDRSARFLLDHGAAARTGLAWEHLA